VSLEVDQRSEPSMTSPVEQLNSQTHQQRLVIGEHPG
jgi:hypothetical protein